MFKYILFIFIIFLPWFLILLLQAVAQKTEVSVQTEPEIPTNACTQYAPETEISVPPSDNAQEAITSQDLNAFFKKYLD